MSLLQSVRSWVDGNDREVARLRKIALKINELEPGLAKLSDAELAAKTSEFRGRLEAGETLDDLLVPAFAVCREAARRTIGMRHFDVQLIGGMVLHEGKVAEMRTGEGKTLVATLPVYLNALSGKGVHVVTVKPGFVATPMTAGLPLPGPLVATPDQVASDIVRAVEKRKDVLYTRWFWAIIMLIIRCVPRFLFKRASL